MLAVLASVGIESSRARDKNDNYDLLVDTVDIATSITVLKNSGYPKEQFETLGDVFSASGIVGTPFEQHARFIHAMNQELASAITTISGVRTARVLINSPTQGRYDRSMPAAGASVTIHHEADFEPSHATAMIKQIVSSSVSNLEYDDVAVAFFAAGGPQIKASVDAVPTETNESSIVAMPALGSLDFDVKTVLMAISGVTLFLLIVVLTFGNRRGQLLMRVTQPRFKEHE
jgi:type III secretion protein J